MAIEVLSHKERENRNVALVTTLVFHVLLLLLLFFMKAWQDARLPIQDAGIELNFGLDNAGSGDTQTRNRPSPLKNREESQPAPAEKKQPEITKRVEREQPKTEAVKAPKAKVEELAEVTSKVESPVKVVEKPVKKVEPTPVPKTESKPVVATKPVEAPPRQPDARTLYKKSGVSTGSSGTGTNGNGTVGTNPNPGGNNNGDDANGVGDKGSPEGKLDAKALYGKAGNGGSGGVALNVTGWRMPGNMKEKDPYQETGFVLLRIRVNSDGNVEGNVTVEEKTVSQQVANFYIALVRRLTFVPNNPGGKEPESASGTIKFTIKAK